MSTRICFLWLFLVAAMPSHADESGPPKFSFDANVYPYLDSVDTDTDTTFVINARLPNRFSYFSYQNFTGVLGSSSAAFSRSEQNLRWAIAEDLPIDLNTQAILVRGDGNDVLQFGLGFRMHDIDFVSEFFDRLHMIYRLTFHVKRFSSGDDKVWQMEHFFRVTFPYISDRLYISGFVDQTFDLDLPDAMPDKPIVSEVQLGLRLFRDLHAVTEYRVNEFRSGNEHNLAIGLEYKFRW